MKLTPEKCAAYLVDNVNRQIEHYCIVSALSKRQYKFLERGNSLGMEKAAKKRDHEIVRIQVLLREAEGYRKYWRETREFWPENLLFDVETAGTALKRVLLALMKLDEKLSTAVAARMEEVSKEISKMRVARKNNLAYKAPKSKPIPHYTDRKG